MTLKEQINKDLLSAIKNKDNTTRDLLRVVKGEISREEAGLKEFNDVDVLKLINKTINNLKLFKTTTSEDEINILSKYIPQQLTESEVEDLIQILIFTHNYNTMRDMGKIVGYFNDNYPGRVSGKVISEAFKKIIG